MGTVTFPKIRQVKPKPGKTLLIEFVNGVRKAYDCEPPLKSDAFRPLEDMVSAENYTNSQNQEITAHQALGTGVILAWHRFLPRNNG